MQTASPPPPPDPVATANAQAAMNKETAITQYGLNATNQYTPYGNREYQQSGTWSDGTPHYSVTETLTPEQQAIFNTNQKTQQNIANIGRDQSGRIGNLLSQPIELGDAAKEARLLELGTSRLTPQWARDEEALRTRLVNSGIQEGSDAWNAEMGRMDQSKNDALNQLLLSGRGQVNQEIITERNQPINEITALMSGSQVSQPNFTGTPQTSMQAPDYMGAVYQNYQGQLNNYNQEVANNNAMMGGLFGMAAAPLGGWGMSGFKKFW